MNARQKSIQILQDAVKNKTLGAYKGATACRYYDKTTDSCCAVGALIPREELMQHVNEYGDVDTFVEGVYGSIDRILNYGKWYNITGLTNDELLKLQESHDDIVVHRDTTRIEIFESYVASLV